MTESPPSSSKKNRKGKKKKKRVRKKSASKLATLCHRQINRSVACFCREQFKSVSLFRKKNVLTRRGVWGGWMATQVPVRKACLFILNAPRETLNCIFHLRAAGMMAPHSKLNQTCIASRKTWTAVRRHQAPPPLSSYWLNPGVQPITCCQTCVQLAGGRVRHTLLCTEVCWWCLSVGTLIVLLQLHRSSAENNGNKKVERNEHKSHRSEQLNKCQHLFFHASLLKTGTVCGLTPLHCNHRM